MPLRTVSSPFITFLGNGVLTLALCAKLVRQDGVALTFTSHDSNLVITENGLDVTYVARNSVEATALRQESNGGVDNVEVQGLLESDLIKDADIRAGLYDGAIVQFFMVNYRDLSMGALTLLTGTLGEVGYQSGQFTAEVRSLTQRLSQEIGELTSPLCRVKQLGDSRCKVTLAAFQFVRTVSAIDDVYTVRFGVDSHVDGYFTYGRVIVTSGLNIGLQREIKDHTNIGGTVAFILLQEAFPYAFVIGDTVTLEAGCDRRFASCRDKFANVNNFRGEPSIPGTGKIVKHGRR